MFNVEILTEIILTSLSSHNQVFQGFWGVLEILGSFGILWVGLYLYLQPGRGQKLDKLSGIKLIATLNIFSRESFIFCDTYFLPKIK